MKISLLIDHPKVVGKIAKWYYHEWGHLSLEMTEEVIYQKVLEKAAHRDVIPLAIVVHHEKELIGVLELKRHENKNYQNLNIGSEVYLLILYGEDKGSQAA